MDTEREIDKIKLEINRLREIERLKSFVVSRALDQINLAQKAETKEEKDEHIEEAEYQIEELVGMYRAQGDD